MSEGKKYDEDKLRMDLIPVGPLRKVAEVYTIGARKYDDRNWELGIEWGRIYAALLRHVTAWWGGEQKDPIDGQHHLASVVWAAMALMEYEETHPELDDRPRKGEAETTRDHFAGKRYLCPECGLWINEEARPWHKCQEVRVTELL